MNFNAYNNNKLLKVLQIFFKCEIRGEIFIFLFLILLLVIRKFNFLLRIRIKVIEGKTNKFILLNFPIFIFFIKMQSSLIQVF